MVNQTKEHKTIDSVLKNHAGKFEPDMSFVEALRQDLHTVYKNTYYTNKRMKFSQIFKQKRLLFGGSLAILVVTIATAIAAFNGSTLTPNTPANPQNTLKAEVVFIENDVEVQKSNEGWKQATEDQLLEQGDMVRTLTGSKAIINLDDGSAIRLNENSQITLTSLNPYAIQVSNNEGEIYTRVSEAGRTFEVFIDDISFESLGTAYKTINSVEVKGVYVYQSKVQVKQTPQDKMIVEEGNKYLIVKNGENVNNKITQDEINDKFAQWNKEEDSKQFSDKLGIFKPIPVEIKPEEQKPVEVAPSETQSPAPAPQPEAPTNPTLVVTNIIANDNDGAFKVFWSIQNGTAQQGFKVNYSTTNPTPSYGGAGSQSQYVSNPAATYSAVGGLTGGTYYVNVCRYTGGSCDSYSNTVTVTITPPPPVTGITLTSAGGATVSWTVEGGPGKGFKVGWSLTPGLTIYPNATNAQFYNTGTTSADITPVQGSGTYYVSVCAYNGNGGCTAVSNEITVTL